MAQTHSQMQKQNYFEASNIDRADMIEVLEKGSVGHLGCVNHNEVYVVPITYAYDHGFIFSHSRPGKKLEMMRASPRVCFQVEDVDDLTQWKSVIAWGEFEEVRDLGEIERAKNLLLNKLAESVKEARARNIASDHSIQENFEAHLNDSIIYRIKISKITGCSESDSL